MKKAIVVGSGAGGATVAKELQGKYDVTVLEAGAGFRPSDLNLSVVEKFKKTGLLFDERLIQLLFPVMRIRKTSEKMVLVNGIGTGGTTTISTANAVQKDQHLRTMGIFLDIEFEELSKEIPISTKHQKNWRDNIRHIFEICQEMALQPVVTPKMVDLGKCIRCGRCVLGCQQGAKWDSRHFLNQAIENGARLITGCRAHKVVIENKRAIGVQAILERRPQFYPADLVVLAAGGLSTPMILQNSEIECTAKLFVDPVLCVAARWDGCRQYQDIPMPFIVQKEHFILSPYFDFLSFFFNRKWKFRARDIFSLQIKLADSNYGSISKKGIQKTLINIDKERLREGVRICTEIFNRLGIKNENIFLGTTNAGHPGGMLPLTERETATLHHDVLPGNLYIADATLLPDSLGNPPSLVIMALAKRIGKICLEDA
ncbi:MAG: GMC family oxidoreductase [Spirochaetaceae bacterium]|nr:MAG: GMC family oxidoreductase [Spirochaetaceae bacterium]